jgi:hypothetical protein
MFSWIGYKNPSEEVKEEEVKIEPPQKLERSTAVWQGKKDDVIYWKDYDEVLKKLREDLDQLKIESDERWNKRLSPVMNNKELIIESPKKKRKKSKTAS